MSQGRRTPRSAGVALTKRAAAAHTGSLMPNLDVHVRGRKDGPAARPSTHLRMSAADLPAEVAVLQIPGSDHRDANLMGADTLPWDNLRFSDKQGNNMGACSIGIELAVNARTGTFRGAKEDAAGPEGQSSVADLGMPFSACGNGKAALIACVAFSRMRITWARALSGATAPSQLRFLTATCKT